MNYGAIYARITALISGARDAGNVRAPGADIGGVHAMTNPTPTPFYRQSYGNYLASRQWALKKRAVRERSGGMCERCHLNAASQVHHRTYDHLYNEPLEDLEDLCAGCHEYESGVSNIDPAASGPMNERQWREFMESPKGELLRRLLG